ncbi:MAG: FixH family protein [Xanthomonadales bacterium]|nr:FixH family protein [Xanthomonadales bacterium]
MNANDDSSRSSGPRSGGAMLWLVVLIPLATVVAGISTVVIATRTGSTDAVIDPVRRTAQVQDSDLRADREAARLGLSGQASLDPQTGAVRLSLAGDAAGAGRLQLTLAHPVRRSEDRDFELVPGGAGVWLGRLDGIDLEHDWNLLLATADGGWRLVGRLTAGSDGFELAAALPADG